MVLANQHFIAASPFEDKLKNWLLERDWKIECYTNEGQQNRLLTIRPKSHNPSQVLVLLHATGFDALYPHVVYIRECLKANIAILAMDLPGHGAQSRGFLDEEALLRAPSLARRYAGEIFGPHLQTVSGLGLSLGGGLLAYDAACAPTKNIPKWSAIAVIAAPTHLRSSLFYLRELISPWQKPWREASEYYNRWEKFPSFLSFKRQTYPIRIANSVPYLSRIDQVLRSASRACLALDQVRRSSIAVPSYFLYSRGDRVAPTDQGWVWASCFPDPVFAEEQSLTHYNLLQSLEGAKKACQFLANDGPKLASGGSSNESSAKPISSE
jgi:hypothetical protein